MAVLFMSCGNVSAKEIIMECKEFLYTDGKFTRNSTRNLIFKWKDSLIGKAKVCCSEFVQSREGFPISNGKVDTIHSSQGITAGEGEEVEYIVLHEWNKKWENRWPGCFYVASSRIKDLMNFFFSSSVDQASFTNIGKTKTFQKVHREEQRLKKKALKNRKKDQQHGIGTKDDFKKLLKEFLDLVEKRHYTLCRNENSTAILEAANKWRAQLNTIASESQL